MSRNVLMYGAPPLDPWPLPQDIAPIGPTFTPFVGPSQLIPSTPLPLTKDSIVRDMVKRIDELRALVAAAEGAREELATLERMLAATRLEPTEEGTP